MAFETYEQAQKRIEAQQELANFIPAPTGGVTVDQVARDAINLIRQLLINENIMKSS